MSKLAKFTSAIKKNLTRSKSMTTTTSSNSTPKLNNTDLHTVLVGKSQRRYLLSSDLLQHPLIRQLINKSSSSEENNGVLVLSCEVVMFEHLLWMLENNEMQLASCSIDELVEFYSY